MLGSTVRLAFAATGTLVLSLLGASISEAGPARRATTRSERTFCGAPARAPSPPTSQLRSFSRRSLFGSRQLVHRHVMAKLQVNRLKRLVDDDEAINPAVSGHDTPALFGPLEPIGMLAVPSCRPASHPTVSRRSPRGPPLPPDLV